MFVPFRIYNKKETLYKSSCYERPSGAINVVVVVVAVVVSLLVCLLPLLLSKI